MKNIAHPDSTNQEIFPPLVVLLLSLHFFVPSSACSRRHSRLLLETEREMEKEEGEISLLPFFPAFPCGISSRTFL